MAYSETMLKGRIGFNKLGWPLIVMERAKSDKPNTPVLCEVWGFAHECGSVYYSEIELTNDENTWADTIRAMGGEPENHYFKGQLLTA